MVARRKSIFFSPSLVLSCLRSSKTRLLMRLFFIVSRACATHRGSSGPHAAMACLLLVLFFLSSFLPHPKRSQGQRCNRRHGNQHAPPLSRHHRHHHGCKNVHLRMWFLPVLVWMKKKPSSSGQRPRSRRDSVESVWVYDSIYFTKQALVKFLFFCLSFKKTQPWVQVPRQSRLHWYANVVLISTEAFGGHFVNAFGCTRQTVICGGATAIGNRPSK